MHRPQGPEAITSNPWAPLVQARRVGHQLKYWCRSCQERHSEDACIGTEGCSWADGESEKCTCPLGSGDGYRLPTCDNPEWVAGYDLKETRSLDAGPTSLYRLYGHDGALLYIGIAGNPGQRFHQHASDKPWWVYVAHITLTHYNTRREAAAAEVDAIRNEHPLLNVHHSPHGAEHQGHPAEGPTLAPATASPHDTAKWRGPAKGTAGGWPKFGHQATPPPTW